MAEPGLSIFDLFDETWVSHWDRRPCECGCRTIRYETGRHLYGKPCDYCQQLIENYPVEGERRSNG